MFGECTGPPGRAVFGFRRGGGWGSCARRCPPKQAGMTGQTLPGRGEMLMAPAASCPHLRSEACLLPRADADRVQAHHRRHSSRTGSDRTGSLWQQVWQTALGQWAEGKARIQGSSGEQDLR